MWRFPLAYTVYERPTYSVVRSNALWNDPAHAAEAKLLSKAEEDNRRFNLFFPQVIRDARRIGEYHPGLSPNSPECMDKLGVALAHCESKCENFYDPAEVERVFYPEIENLLLAFSRTPPMRSSTTTTSLTRTTRATAPKTRTPRNRA